MAKEKIINDRKSDSHIINTGYDFVRDEDPDEKFAREYLESLEIPKEEGDSLIVKSFKLLGRFKIYVAKTSVYLSIFNTLLIFLTFKSIYNIPVPAYIIVIVGVIGVVVIGYLDYRFITYYQNEHLNKKNDLKKDLELIKKQLAVKQELKER